MFQLKAVAQKVSRGLLLTRPPKNLYSETALLLLAPGMSEINRLPLLSLGVQESSWNIMLLTEWLRQLHWSRSLQYYHDTI